MRCLVVVAVVVGHIRWVAELADCLIVDETALTGAITMVMLIDVRRVVSFCDDRLFCWRNTFGANRMHFGIG